MLSNIASGFAYVSLCSQGDVGQCASILPRGMTLSYYLPDPVTDGNYITTTAILTSSKIVQGVQINGYNFAGQIATTISSTPTAQSTSQYLTSSQTTSITSGAALPGTTKSDSSLTTGVIAGISVGVALSVIGFICLLVGILYVRRQKVKHRYMVTPTVSDKKPENAPVEFQEMDGRGRIQEVPSGDVIPKWGTHEMDAT